MTYKEAADIFDIIENKSGKVTDEQRYMAQRIAIEALKREARLEEILNVAGLEKCKSMTECIMDSYMNGYCAGYSCAIQILVIGDIEE